MVMKSGLAKLFLGAMLLMANPIGAESAMPQELVCRFSADTGEVDPAVLVEFCTNLSRRLQATLLINQAPDLSANSPLREIYVLDIAVTSASTLKITYAFGSTQAWQAGNESRYDDLGFDVMDAKINETTIGRLTDTLLSLSAS